MKEFPGLPQRDERRVVSCGGSVWSERDLYFVPGSDPISFYNVKRLNWLELSLAFLERPSTNGCWSRRRHDYFPAPVGLKLSEVPIWYTPFPPGCLGMFRGFPCVP